MPLGLLAHAGSMALVAAACVDEKGHQWPMALSGCHIIRGVREWLRTTTERQSTLDLCAAANGDSLGVRVASLALEPRGVPDVC